MWVGVWELPPADFWRATPSEWWLVFDARRTDLGGKRHTPKDYDEMLRFALGE